MSFINIKEPEESQLQIVPKQPQAVVYHKKELFNASGEQLEVLNHLLRQNEKRIEARKEKAKIKWAEELVEEILHKKRHDYQIRRLYNSPMSTANKMAIYGDEYHLRQELELGFRVDTRDHITGRTLLQEAANAGHLHIVRMLCREYKANPNIVTIMGRTTALHFAVAGNYRQICVILCHAGADTNFQNSLGNTPLHEVKSKSVLRVLAVNGASPLIYNKEGLNPRLYYEKYVPVDKQDPKILKRLQQIEEYFVQEKFRSSIAQLQMAQIFLNDTSRDADEGSLTSSRNMKIDTQFNRLSEVIRKKTG